MATEIKIIESIAIFAIIIADIGDIKLCIGHMIHVIFLV
jgi:hypothetical protein